MPGVEFDVFPYSESHQAEPDDSQYTRGAAAYREYELLTIYDKLRRPTRSHAVVVSLGHAAQPWGQA
jgi:hypothetical protein